MTVGEVAEKLGLEVLAEGASLAREITGGYASDLLSDVLAHGRAGDVWVTLQTHHNIIAVASMKDLAAVILVNGRQPEAEALAAASREGVPVLSSPLPAFALIGELCRLGIRGAA